MMRLLTIVSLAICIHLRQYSVEATVFVCNATAACGCSRNDADVRLRIVGGDTAVSHSWGWAVSLRDYSDESICGGSILSPNYVLTAAHCVVDSVGIANLYSVVVGADRLSSSEGQKISLSRIIIHPSYNRKTNENDIALLYLSKPINLADPNVAKMCLPAVPELEQSRYPVVTKSIVAIGWGTTSQGGSVSDTLRQVTVKTVASKDKTCKSTIRNDKLQFCAAVSGGGKDTCQGDSGGPIMYYSEADRVWVLAGVTSYGRGCASPNYAGIYTRVSAYIDWIKSNVNNDGIVTVAQNKANVNSVSVLITLFLALSLSVVNINSSKM